MKLLLVLGLLAVFNLQKSVTAFGTGLSLQAGVNGGSAASGAAGGAGAGLSLGGGTGGGLSLGGGGQLDIGSLLNIANQLGFNLGGGGSATAQGSVGVQAPAINFQPQESLLGQLLRFKASLLQKIAAGLDQFKTMVFSKLKLPLLSGGLQLGVNGGITSGGGQPAAAAATMGTSNNGETINISVQTLLQLIDKAIAANQNTQAPQAPNTNNAWPYPNQPVNTANNFPNYGYNNYDPYNPPFTQTSNGFNTGVRASIYAAPAPPSPTVINEFLHEMYDEFSRRNEAYTVREYSDGQVILTRNSDNSRFILNNDNQLVPF